MSPRWTIRSAEPDDVSFIYSTWLNSFYYDSWVKSVRKGVYFSNYKKIIDRLLLTADISVACNPDAPNVIYGYMVSDPGIMHYVFVKEAFRMFGIAKDLASKKLSCDAGFEITHKTRSITEVLVKNPQLIFNPFILFQQEQS